MSGARMITTEQLELAIDMLAWPHARLARELRHVIADACQIHRDTVHRVFEGKRFVANGVAHPSPLFAVHAS